MHQEFVRRLGGDPDRADGTLRAWYRDVSDEWSTGDRASQPIGEDAFQFWRLRFAERWPPTAGGGARTMEAAAAVGRRVMERRQLAPNQVVCQHDPPCRSTSACVEVALAEARQARERAS